MALILSVTFILCEGLGCDSNQDLTLCVGVIWVSPYLSYFGEHCCACNVGKIGIE